MSSEKKQSRRREVDVMNYCALMGWSVSDFLGAYEDLVSELWPPDDQGAWVSSRLVRRRDPATSVEAAMIVAPKLQPLQVIAFTVMMKYAYPQVHDVCEVVFRACGIHTVDGMSTARSRVNELRTMLGLVEYVGEKARKRSGNRGNKYRVIPGIRRRAAVIMNRHGLDVSETEDPEPPEGGRPVFGPVPPDPQTPGACAVPQEEADRASRGDSLRAVISLVPEPIEEEPQSVPLETPECVTEEDAVVVATTFLNLAEGVPPDHPARVVPLDEDTGNLKNYWLRSWRNQS